MNVPSMEVEYWLSDDGLMLLEAYARDGLVDRDICNIIGIAPKTLVAWKKNYPEIKEALSKGKAVIDYRVENALLKSAIGYTKKSTKVIMRLRQGKLTTVEQETTLEEVGPNPTSCMCWLNNRKPNEWKRNRDNFIQEDSEDSKITINVIRHGEQVDTTPVVERFEDDWDDEDEEWLEEERQRQEEYDEEDDWDEEPEEEPQPTKRIIKGDKKNIIPVPIVNVKPENVQENLNPKNTNMNWKEPGTWEDRGNVYKRKKPGKSLNQEAIKTNSIKEEEDWDDA